jgi:hypothetical protein
MNPAGRVRCNIMPIARGYSRVSQPLFYCARLTLWDTIGAFPQSSLKPRHARGFLYTPCASAGIELGPEPWSERG